jgi:predicted enzyme related to lactoylglutathione lyase
MATKKKVSGRKAAKKVASKPARRNAPAKKKAAPKKKAAQRTRSKATARADVPSLFRINVETGNLDDAQAFYGELFGIEGRRQAGSRVYFQCGAVTLQVVDVAAMGMGVPHPAAKALYFLVDDLDAVFARAAKLGCLSRELVHGTPGGAISVRPWGERSFYAQDKWLNPLCFVEAGTTYPG